MDIPLLGFIAQVTLFAFPICWLFRFLESLIVGIKSDFWDAFLVCFLYLIGMNAIYFLLVLVLNGLPWVLYDILSFVATFLLWVVVVRGVLKHDLGKCVKVSIAIVPVLHVILWLLSLAGISI